MDPIMLGWSECNSQILNWSIHSCRGFIRVCIYPSNPSMRFEARIGMNGAESHSPRPVHSVFALNVTARSLLLRGFDEGGGCQAKASLRFDDAPAMIDELHLLC